MTNKDLEIFSRSYTQGKFKSIGIPFRLFVVSSLIAILLWICAFTRHILLQSNVYDLGIFDQWFWLISKGIEPISSTTKVHVLSDHAAWSIYLFAPLYKLSENINWLFLTQAISLSFTAIPLWKLSIKAGLDSKQSWLICSIWWLQPVVFNINLFDFHPEVWAMPFLASCYLAAKNKNTLLWTLLIIFSIGCRDGLILVIAGFGIEQIIRKNWKFAYIAIGISTGWFLFIKIFLFPYLKQYSNGEMGATESILMNLTIFLENPIKEVQNIDFSGGFIYILLISIAFIPFWKKSSIPTLCAWIPLAFLNFVANNPSFRTLIHQYSLPIALIGVVSVIEALSKEKQNSINWWKFCWIAACWFALAKPYFFTGPYLKRVKLMAPVYSALAKIPKDANVITTSYIAPHISHRKNIIYPREGGYTDQYIENFDVILLNPLDPGWDSSKEVQKKLLSEAKIAGWACSEFPRGLELCNKY